MGSKEILQVVELFSNEKGIPKGIVFEAIEQALATATRKRYEDEEADIRVAIDRATGDYDTFRRWVVVPDDHLAILGSELTTEEAAEIDTGLQVGDEYEIEVESVDFGRIEAQTAKQVIVQKVREAEREKVVADYESRLLSLINGTVKKVTRDSVIVDLGGAAEALMPRENLWVLCHTMTCLTQCLPRQQQCVDDLKCGHQSVAGRCEVRANNVTRCLAAQCPLALLHCLNHITVADARSYKWNLHISQRFFET